MTMVHAFVEVIGGQYSYAMHLVMRLHHLRCIWLYMQRVP